MKDYLLKSLILGALLLQFIAVKGEKEIFKVLASNGITLVERSDQNESWSPIKTDAKLYLGDKLIITEGSYLGLLHIATNKVSELREAGVYKIKSLSDKIIKKQASISRKYINYVVNDLTNGKKGENFHKHMKVTGSVERGHEKPGDIRMVFPNKSYLLDSIIPVHWYPVKGTTQQYYVSLLNMFEEELKSVETNDTFTTLNLKGLDLEEEQFYMIQVSLVHKKSIASRPANIYIPTKEKTEEVEKKLSRLKREIDTESALGQAMLGFFYEEHKYYHLAFEAYLKASKLAPGMQQYKEIYQKFLQRHQLVKN